MSTDGELLELAARAFWREVLDDQDGYWCVVCGKFLPANEYGVVVHDNIPHLPSMTFDEMDNPQ